MNTLPLNFNIAILTLIISTCSYASRELGEKENNMLSINSISNNDSNTEIQQEEKVSLKRKREEEKNDNNGFTREQRILLTELNIDYRLDCCRSSELSFSKVELLLGDTRDLIKLLGLKFSFDQLSAERLNTMKKVANVILDLPQEYDSKIKSLEGKLKVFKYPIDYYRIICIIFKNLSKKTKNSNELLNFLSGHDYYLRRYYRFYDKTGCGYDLCHYQKLGSVQAKIADLSINFQNKVDFYLSAAQNYKYAYEIKNEPALKVKKYGEKSILCYQNVLSLLSVKKSTSQFDQDSSSSDPLYSNTTDQTQINQIKEKIELIKKTLESESTSNQIQKD